jgi:tRNA modification GTPase
MAPPGSLSVSSLTGSGVAELLRKITNCAQDLLPAEGANAINQRQSDCLVEAQGEIEAASTDDELVVIADRLRAARQAFDRLTGRAGIEDMLDALFGRFCLGK